MWKTGRSIQPASQTAAGLNEDDTSLRHCTGTINMPGTPWRDVQEAVRWLDDSGLNLATRCTACITSIHYAFALGSR
jgi:hypothetical protein